MDSLKATMMQAVSGMQLQSKRIDISSQNVSNADTPGYRRKILSVEQAPTAADAFIATRIELDQTEGERSYDPASPLADAEVMNRLPILNWKSRRPWAVPSGRRAIRENWSSWPTSNHPTLCS